MQVRIVKASSSSVLEKEINSILSEYSNEVVDIKISGTSDNLYALIMFKE